MYSKKILSPIGCWIQRTCRSGCFMRRRQATLQDSSTQLGWQRWNVQKRSVFLVFLLFETINNDITSKCSCLGVCSVDFNNPDMTVAFQNIGIQCVKRRDAPASLARREQIQVDPFKQGFRHKNASINLNSIRLCFQVSNRSRILQLPTNFF